MRILFLAIALIAAQATPAAAQYGQQWQSASLVRSEPLQGAFGYNRCIYRTLGGYEFETNTRGMCRYSVRVNLETGEVR